MTNSRLYATKKHINELSLCQHAQVLVGLGAALLSDEKHAHAKPGGHRPVNIKKIMATLVVQRALKRNMMQKRGKFNLADIVLAVEGKARRASRTRQHLPSSSGLYNLNNAASGLLGCTALGDTGRLSSTGELSTTGQGGLEGQQGHQQRWQQQQRLKYNKGNARGSAGSIVLPPDADESKWLMRRFLVDLHRHNDRDDEEGGDVPQTSGSGSVSQAGGSGPDTALSRATALHLLNSRSISRSSGAGTEIGSPSPRGPASTTTPGRNFSGYGIPYEEKLDEKEGKVEERPDTSLAMWLRDRDSIDL